MEIIIIIVLIPGALASYGQKKEKEEFKERYKKEKEREKSLR